MNSYAHTGQAVQFTITRQEGQVVSISTNSLPVNHFLDMIEMSKAYNTWVGYAHDLKAFFQVIPKPPEGITRPDCVAFMKQQDQAGYSDATINRRLAAVSSLFNELGLLDPDRFPRNPICPYLHRREWRQRSQSLYRRQAQRIPDVLSQDALHTFFAALPSWRDRTLVLLMWISCLRVSEAVAIRFQDIECSRRSILISAAKGNKTRMVFMNPPTFASLNHYLDEERAELFPDVDHVFVAFKGVARGKPLTTNAVQKMIYYYAEKCHLSHIHAHLFRHTGITQLVEEAMPEPAIREMVGHRRPESLTPYLHLSDESVQKEFEKAQMVFDPSEWLDSLLPRGEL